jgi:phosphatidate cytidylyltransferase
VTGWRAGGRFQDLAPRLASGVVLAAVGLGATWAGGWLFLALVVVVTALMVWELARLFAPGAGWRPAGLAGLAGAAVAATALMPVAVALPMVLMPALAGLAVLPANRRVFATYASFTVVAGYGLWHVRTDLGPQGFPAMLWLALVVVATDVAGYFAGRLIGGPKFWPRVSPSKTWAGTVAGWVGAAAVGFAFAAPVAGAAAALAGVSVAVAMASQIGDAAESAIKRRVGVKDASRLIPGHGGVMDRFDGMLGAAVMFLIAERVVDLPPLLVGG